MSNKKKTGILTALLAFALVVSLAFTSSAASGTLTKEQIDAVVGTATDTSKIESPFLAVANSVRESVVGVNNYQMVTSRGNSFGDFGFGFGYYNEPNAAPRELLRGTGSGVVISEYGHILTNNHVIQGASRITVTFGTKEAEAQLIVSDEALDVAVLLVPGIGLKPVELGDSDSIQVGEWAIVIGNPLGQEFDRSVTVGVVSAYDRSIQGSGNDRYGRRTTVTNSMIQTDAAISSGNSGGGMFNMLGQLQGIPTLKYDSSPNMYSNSPSIDNIGMCVPINAAKPLIKSVLESFDEAAAIAQAENRQGESSQNPARPRIGVTVATMAPSYLPVAQGLLPQGAYIVAVEANSPAETAGLQAGDIVVEANGDIVKTQTQLIEKLQTLKEGDFAQLKVYRVEGLPEALEDSNLLDSLEQGEYMDLSVQLLMLDPVGM